MKQWFKAYGEVDTCGQPPQPTLNQKKVDYLFYTQPFYSVLSRGIVRSSFQGGSSDRSDHALLDGALGWTGSVYPSAGCPVGP